MDVDGADLTKAGCLVCRGVDVAMDLRMERLRLLNSQDVLNEIALMNMRTIEDPLNMLIVEGCCASAANITGRVHNLRTGPGDRVDGQITNGMSERRLSVSPAQLER